VDCHDWVDDCFCLVHAPALGKSQVNGAKYFILFSGVVLERACLYIMKYILFKQLSSMCVCMYRCVAVLHGLPVYLQRGTGG
jgi:hypothetical protein